ncbi:hypothetical protein NL676_026043 [Syzygium grande]|nr:hypothetical protein NL676_026043 [Syzygium grande]
MPPQVLLVGGLISLCSNGFQQNMEKKEAEGDMVLAEHFGNLLGVDGKSTNDGLFTLVIKSPFLHCTVVAVQICVASAARNLYDANSVLGCASQIDFFQV